MKASTHLELASAQLLTHLQPGIHHPLQVPLQTAAKVAEHGGASRQNDVLQARKPDGRGLTAATCCQAAVERRSMVVVTRANVPRACGLTL